jgi:dihydrofolate reductase
MGELQVHAMSVSLDGYAAGPGQRRDQPLGEGGERLHEWIFAPDRSPADEAVIARSTAGIGATIMGRNMFGPVRGPWEAEAEWRGWWGEDPPFHHDVFVLTHHRRPPLTMSGGTTFHFVTDGPRAALDRAVAAAGDRAVRLGGGVSTIQQYLRAGLLDEIGVAVVPVLLGGGERLFADGLPMGGWRAMAFEASARVAHVRLRRDPAASAQADDGAGE